MSIPAINRGIYDTTGISNDISTRSLDSVFIGIGAGKINRSPGNTFVGAYAGSANRGGSNNTFMGAHVGEGAANSYFNTFFGAFSGKSFANGGYNVFIGAFSGELAQESYENVFIGPYAGRENLSGSGNVLVGMRAGERNAYGDNNTIMGSEAGQDNRSGSNNAFFGYRAGRGNQRGNYNTFIGNLAGLNNQSGGYNVFVGNQSGANNTEGTDNTFVGSHVGLSNASGAQNTFVGKDAALRNSTGNRNTIVGAYSASNMTIGANNTILGYETAPLLGEGSNNVFIGPGADVVSSIVGNSIVISSINAKSGEQSIVIGNENYNSRNETLSIGFNILTDAKNTLMIGRHLNLESGKLFTDPLSSIYQDSVLEEGAIRFGISNIDYESHIRENYTELGLPTSNVLDSTNMPFIPTPNSNQSWDLTNVFPKSLFICGRTIAFSNPAILYSGAYSNITSNPYVYQNCIVSSSNGSNTTLLNSDSNVMSVFPQISTGNFAWTHDKYTLTTNNFTVANGILKLTQNLVNVPVRAWYKSKKLINSLPIANITLTGGGGSMAALKTLLISNWVYEIDSTRVLPSFIYCIIKTEDAPTSGILRFSALNATSYFPLDVLNTVDYTVYGDRPFVRTDQFTVYPVCATTLSDGTIEGYIGDPTVVNITLTPSELSIADTIYMTDETFTYITNDMFHSSNTSTPLQVISISDGASLEYDGVMYDSNAVYLANLYSSSTYITARSDANILRNTTINTILTDNLTNLGITSNLYRLEMGASNVYSTNVITSLANLIIANSALRTNISTQLLFAKWTLVTQAYGNVVSDFINNFATISEITAGYNGLISNYFIINSTLALSNVVTMGDYTQAFTPENEVLLSSYVNKLNTNSINLPAINPIVNIFTSFWNNYYQNEELTLPAWSTLEKDSNNGNVLILHAPSPDPLRSVITIQTNLGTLNFRQVYHTNILNSNTSNSVILTNPTSNVLFPLVTASISNTTGSQWTVLSCSDVVNDTSIGSGNSNMSIRRVNLFSECNVTWNTLLYDSSNIQKSSEVRFVGNYASNWAIANTIHAPYIPSTSALVSSVTSLAPGAPTTATYSPSNIGVYNITYYQLLPGASNININSESWYLVDNLTQSGTYIAEQFAPNTYDYLIGASRFTSNVSVYEAPISLFEPGIQPQSVLNIRKYALSGNLEDNYYISAPLVSTGSNTYIWQSGFVEERMVAYYVTDIYRISVFVSSNLSYIDNGVNVSTAVTTSNLLVPISLSNINSLYTTGALTSNIYNHTIYQTYSNVSTAIEIGTTVLYSTSNLLINNITSGSIFSGGTGISSVILPAYSTRFHQSNTLYISGLTNGTSTTAFVNGTQRDLGKWHPITTAYYPSTSNLSVAILQLDEKGRTNASNLLLVQGKPVALSNIIPVSNRNGIFLKSNFERADFIPVSSISQYIYQHVNWQQAPFLSEVIAYCFTDDANPLNIGAAYTPLIRASFEFYKECGPLTRSSFNVGIVTSNQPNPYISVPVMVPASYSNQTLNLSLLFSSNTSNGLFFASNRNSNMWQSGGVSWNTRSNISVLFPYDFRTSNQRPIDETLTFSLRLETGVSTYSNLLTNQTVQAYPYIWHNIPNTPIVIKQVGTPTSTSFIGNPNVPDQSIGLFTESQYMPDWTQLGNLKINGTGETIPTSNIAYVLYDIDNPYHIYDTTLASRVFSMTHYGITSNRYVLISANDGGLENLSNVSLYGRWGYDQYGITNLSYTGDISPLTIENHGFYYQNRTDYYDFQRDDSGVYIVPIGASLKNLYNNSIIRSYSVYNAAEGFSLTSTVPITISLDETSQYNLSDIYAHPSISGLNLPENLRAFLVDPPTKGVVMKMENGIVLASNGSVNPVKIAGAPIADWKLTDYIVYQHVGMSTTQDTFSLLLSSSFVAPGYVYVNVTVNIRRVPRITEIRNRFAYFDTIAAAVSSSNRVLDYVHITDASQWNNCFVNIVSGSNIVSITGNNTGSNALAYYTSNMIVSLTHSNAPYPVADMELTLHAGGGLNPLQGVDPAYRSRFVYPWSVYTNHLVQSNVLVGSNVNTSNHKVTYQFTDASYSNFIDSTTRLDLDFNSITTVNLLSTLPTLLREKVTSIVPMNFSINVLDTNNSNRLGFNINRNILTYNGVTDVLGSYLQENIFHQLSIQTNNPLNGNGTVAINGSNALTISSLSTNAFATINKLELAVDLLDSTGSYVTNIQGNNVNLGLSLVMDNLHPVIHARNFQLVSKKVNDSDTQSFNMVIGDTITVLGTNNICLGKNYTATGANSIIVGTDIGIDDNNGISFNSLYDSIIIGSSNFRNTIVRNTTCIGNGNFVNLFTPTIGQPVVTDEAVNQFFTKSPVLIGNQFNNNMLDYHVNVGNVFLKTSVNKQQVYVGYDSNECVVIGASSNIGCNIPIGTTLEVTGIGGIRVANGTEGTQVQRCVVSTGHTVFPGFPVISTGYDVVLNRVSIGLTDTPDSPAVLGVVQTVHDSSNVMVTISGVVKVCMPSGASWAIGDLLVTSGVIGTCVSSGSANITSSVIGKALTSSVGATTVTYSSISYKEAWCVIR